jgi:hypothetical protein
MLRQLLDELEIDPARWTTARTAFLYALATPTEGDDGRWDVLVRIQPNDPDLETLAGWVVRVEGMSPPISAEIDDGGRFKLCGLTGDRSYALRVYKPAEMLPGTVRDQLKRDLAAAAQAWANVLQRSDAEKTEKVAAREDGSGFTAESNAQLRKALIWRSSDTLLTLEVKVSSAGDAVMRFRSGDRRLDGVPILVRVGGADRRIVFRDVGANAEAEVNLDSNAAFGRVGFELM